MQAMFGAKEETKALLRHGAKSLSRDCDEALLWSCDVARSKAQGISRTYEALVPWDVLFSLVFMGVMGALGMLLPFLCLRYMYGSWMPLPLALKDLVPEILWCGIPCTLAFFALVVGQIPTRIIREPDALVVELLTSRHVVPLEEVLELVVLNSARGARFSDLLTRWAIFPFGFNAHLFRGVPSMNGVCCVLLTRHCFWSFVFCLKDPVPFLLDNQKALEPGKRYRTAHKVLVREGVELTSPKAAIVPKGHWMRVEKQSGRRCFVRFEDSHVHGWLSYISSQGHFLLAKDREAGAAGLVGASEFVRSYGGSGSIELKDFVVPEGDIIE